MGTGQFDRWYIDIHVPSVKLKKLTSRNASWLVMRTNLIVEAIGKARINDS